MIRVSPVQAQDGRTAYLLEAEDFQFKGGWLVEKEPGKPVSGKAILRVLSGKIPAADAVTVVKVQAPGTYAIWVRTADYPAMKPGTRLLRVYVNEQAMQEESGKHGKDGYYWEKAGALHLQAGEAVIRLKDSRANFARCDALLLTTENGFDPNTKTLASLAAYKIVPVPQKATAVQYPVLSPAIAIANGVTTVAAIGNDKIRLRFVQAANGEKQLAAQSEVSAKGQWISMNVKAADHKIYLLRADNPQLSFGSFFPSWNGSTGFTSFTHQSKQYAILEPENAMNPFMAGILAEAIPVAVSKINDTALAVTYTTGNGQELTGLWTLPRHASHLLVTLQYKVPQNGYYSFGVAAFQSMAPEQATNIQLPPMFQYKRISPQPVLLPSGMMPQPVAIAETKSGSGLFSSFVSATAAAFPLEWGNGDHSVMGFSIKNEQNRVQPVAFAPLLGLRDSRCTAGQVITRSFVVGAVASGWNDAMEYVSDSIYRVKDYRVQKQLSLTETAFNIIDLLKNDTAAGWNAQLKGFYDIEADPHAAPTVVQAAPLALVSAAVLTGDEDFFLSRALPTIEYTLSRSGFRWAKAVSGTPFNSNARSLLLSPYESQFTTAYYEGLNRLLGEANPWLKTIALPGNDIRSARGYSVDVPAWTQELAAWRLTKDQHWLRTAQQHATQYIQRAITDNRSGPLSKQPFYNASFYAYWWEMVDLYEQTKDTAFLQAAQTSAFQTIAGIRSYPQVRDTLQTIHLNNQFEGNTTLWWKGNQKYRLGFPRVKGDAPEKQVPQSLVSPVGLGFEQPFTYFDPGKDVRPVFMSSWAPHLLRLFQYSHKEIFNTYARNAVIGRFTNYPGYYGSGFTDLTMQPDFPYKGPDVSSIYYHHIPPHLAFTLDYLITEAIQRSGGKADFPYGKQDGFVWFNNRVFGGGTGTIYNDTTARLWLKKGLVSLNTPEVNYVTAISNNRFWVLLLNEAATALPVQLTLSKEIIAATTGNGASYKARATTPEAVNRTGNTVNATIGAKGFTALSFPLVNKKIQRPLPAVADGMKVLEVGAPWGKLNCFRIRSPFGWDAVYGYLETAPLPAGSVVTVTMDGDTQTVDAYPFEWHFVKIAATKTVEMKITLKTSTGAIKEEKVVMAGVQ
jgi:hypothetical protein